MRFGGCSPTRSPCVTLSTARRAPIAARKQTLRRRPFRGVERRPHVLLRAPRWSSSKTVLNRAPLAVCSQAASSTSVSLIGTSTPSGKRAANTSSPFIASMNFRRVPM